MKVCMVTTAFPRWKGDGQGAFVWEAACAIARQGANVQIIAMHSPGARTHEVIDGIEVVRPRYWYPEQGEILRKEGSGGIPATWRKYPLARLQLAVFAAVHAATIARYARSADVIHAHWTLSGAAACLGRPIHRCPVLVTLHGSDVFRVVGHPIGAWFTRQVAQRCDRIMAVSSALGKPVIQLGIPSRRIEIIPDGVDTTFFQPPADKQREQVVLFVGSLIERKGVRHLVAAMPKVLRTIPDGRLVVVGDGPQQTMLQEEATRLGIGDKVVFARYQPPNEVRQWMQKAKVFVLPSLEEGLGVVLLEALACGTPIIGTQVNGIPEVVTSDVGMLVPPSDPPSLAEAIISLLSDEAKWQQMSQEARRRAVDCYDWDQVGKRLIDLYSRMLADVGQ